MDDTDRMVGREAEWSYLVKAVERVPVGTTRGAGVAIVGDPGIGKTRLIARLRDEVRRHGRQVVAVRPDRPIAVIGGDPGGSTRPWTEVADVVESVPPGTVVVIDDLHRLRPDSAPLLHRIVDLVMNKPVILVVAYRPRQLTPCLAAVLASEAAGEVLDVLRLEPLDLDAVCQLVGTGPAERLHQASGGNPQYLRLLRDRSVDAASAVVGELSGLTRTQLDVAYAAAALVGPFAPDLLVAVSPLDRATTLAAVDALAAVDLIRVADQPALLEFRHPTVARVVYENEPPIARRAAHGRIETVLAERGASLVRRAHHVARCADRRQPRHIVTLIDAIREVMDHDPPAALEWLDAATGLVSESDRYWYEVQLLWAHVYLRRGHHQESREVLHRLQRWTPAEDVDGPEDWVLGQYSETLALLHDGGPEPDGDVVAARLDVADIALHAMDYPGAIESDQAAMTLARQLGDRAAEARALGHLAWAEASSDAVTVTSSTAAAARFVDDLPDSVLTADATSLSYLVSAELCLDRVSDARRHLVRGIELARRGRQPLVLLGLTKALGDALTRQGRLEPALAALDETIDFARRRNATYMVGIAGALRARALLWWLPKADGHQAVAGVEEAAALCRGLPWLWAVQVRLVQAETVVHSGDPELGLSLLRAAVNGSVSPYLTPRLRLRAWDLAAQAAAALGDASSAQRHARAVEEAAGPGLSTAGRAVVARTRMHAQVARRDPQAALRHASEAIEGFLAAELRLDAGRTALAAADVTVNNPGAGDARALLADAEELAQVSGSGRLLDEVAELRKGPGGESAPCAITGLTAREREIATLASSGITSRDIAQKLHLSVRTVDTHLGRIYRKVGVNGRVALARKVLVDRGSGLALG